MANASSTLDVTSSEQLVVTAPTSAGSDKLQGTIRNTGATDMLVGPSGHCNFPVKATEGWSFSLRAGDSLYVKTASGTTTAAYYTDQAS